MLYVDSFIVQYVKFWDERRAVTRARARAHVVPEEIEDSSRGRGGFVLLTAEGPIVGSNGNGETIIQKPNPRKHTLSAIEEVSSSRIFSSEASSGTMALSLAFQLQTALSEIEDEDEEVFRDDFVSGSVRDGLPSSNDAHHVGVD
jgi:hypothetical protein